ncbi:hypothetical protein EYF80_030443 [Liparis tanakae]|uniref:Uncharacterized protein n=1 Tax=Liparis tanakae TaxID=230148 RepID=A0A4Z2H1L7_9TELE|nr:hypothetical protein EYF80_030443 [Liparis tanakae]
MGRLQEKKADVEVQTRLAGSRHGCNLSGPSRGKGGRGQGNTELIRNQLLPRLKRLLNDT